MGNNSFVSNISGIDVNKIEELSKKELESEK